MNAMTLHELHNGGAVVALGLPDDIAFEDWLSVGRDLARERHNLDWMIGDWWSTGQKRFSEQLELALPEVRLDPKLLTRAAAVASKFRPDERDESLSYQHHAHVAALPPDEARSLLEKARQQGWDAKKTRVEAVKRKVELGQATIFPEDDYEYHELMAIVRAWNRAKPSVRQQFMDLASESHLGSIDA